MTEPNETALWRTPLRREALRWGLAGLVVVTAHISLAYAVAMLAPVTERAAAVEAMTVELTPLVVSTAEPVEIDSAEEERPDVVSELEDQPPAEPEQKVEEIEPEQTAELSEEVPETEQVEEEETAEEEPEKVEEVAEEELVETVEPVPEVKQAEVVLPKPKPVKKRPPKKVERKQPKPEKPVVRKAEVEPKARPSASRQAKVGTQAPRAPSVNPSRWYAQVQAAVARRKPRGMGAAGLVRVRFVVNSSGSVVSAGIARSSGHAMLDRAALSMVQGARLPAPPPELGRSSVPFTVPVNFQ